MSHVLFCPYLLATVNRMTILLTKEQVCLCVVPCIFTTPKFHRNCIANNCNNIWCKNELYLPEGLTVNRQDTHYLYRSGPNPIQLSGLVQPCQRGMYSICSGRVQDEGTLGLHCVCIGMGRLNRTGPLVSEPYSCHKFKYTVLIIDNTE